MVYKKYIFLPSSLILIFELMIEYLQTMINNTEDDPVEEFIGAFNSALPDWTEKHDVYLGKSLSE